MIRDAADREKVGCGAKMWAVASAAGFSFDW